MIPQIGQGILGLSPDWLKFGALGLLAISIIVVGVVVFSGARSKGSFRLALVFMGFTLIVAALAIGSEIYKNNTALDQAVADRDKAIADAKAAEAGLAEAEAARNNADKALADFKAEAKTMAATVNGEVGTIAATLDAKMCVEVDQMNDPNIKRSLGFFVDQMRQSIDKIRQALGVAVPPTEIAAECTGLANP
jgi:hypothetical protein